MKTKTYAPSIPRQLYYGMCVKCGKESPLCAYVSYTDEVGKRHGYWCSSCRIAHKVAWKVVKKPKGK